MLSTVQILVYDSNYLKSFLLILSIISICGLGPDPPMNAVHRLLTLAIVLVNTAPQHNCLLSYVPGPVKQQQQQ